MNNKKMAFPVLGNYKIGDQNFKCNKGDCIGLYDIGRGHFNYHTSWFWATLVTYLPGNRRFGLNLGDGIGV